MYMFKTEFKGLLKQCLKEALDSSDLKDSMHKIAKAVSGYYPGTKIWFARRFGKRWSYISGAGKETYNSPEEMAYLEDYAAFLQNFDEVSSDEKEMLTCLFKLVTAVKQ